MNERDSMIQKLIVAQIGLQPGASIKKIHSAIRDLVPSGRISFSTNLESLITQGKVVSPIVMGEMRYYLGDSVIPANCDDKRGMPVQIKTTFTGGAMTPNPKPNAIAWAMDHCL